MLYITLSYIGFFACIDGEFPKPDNVFPEDQSHDFDNDGYTELDGDCDDEDARVFPGNAQFEPAGLCVLDYDADGFGDATAQTPYDKGSDCDDGTADINPFATEVCDEVDNNCNDIIDFDSEESPTWYRDADGDAFGVEAFTENSCSRPEGYVSFIGDCDDDNPNVNPEAIEVCDGVDNDCDSLVDDQDSFWLRETGQIFYGDGDGDGFGWPGFFVESCSEQVPGMVLNSDDCDDSDRFVNPNAIEICDGIDNDCDLFIDDEDTDEDTDKSDGIPTYVDADQDGFGTASSLSFFCEIPFGRVDIAGDCDDEQAQVYQGAQEICDDVDNDCDGIIDGETAVDALDWYQDSDGDGFGNEDVVVYSCAIELEGFVRYGEDCDDFSPNAASVYPTSDEYCDGIDNNCDGVIDGEQAIDRLPWYADSDGDGYGFGVSVLSCESIEGYVNNDDDCDDTTDLKYPNLDFDNDGFGACEEDCDDQNLLIHPYGNDLVGDGIDQDCDGVDRDQYLALSSMISCGIDGDDIRCWGQGTDTIPKIAIPRTVDMIQAEHVNGCYLDANQHLFCWGIETENWNTNVYSDVGVGESDICVLDQVGQVTCTGELAQDVPSSLFTVLDVGRTHACGITTNQSTICWGDNSAGQSNVPLDMVFVDVSLGNEHSCGLQRDGSIFCWGDNGYEQSNVPTGTFIAIASGNHHVCAIDNSNQVQCWGSIFGIIPIDSYTDIFSGMDYSCAINEQKEVRCWGNNDFEQSSYDVDGDGSSVLRDCDENNTIINAKDEDGDGLSTCEGDCDDSDSSIMLVDNDGDGASCYLDCDDNNAFKNNHDNDLDGYTSCEQDCNDNNPLVNPIDLDGDGYSLCDGDCRDDDDSITPRDDNDGDGFEYCNDCNDFDANTFPGAAFLESDTACMIDADGDGWGEDLTHKCCFSLLLQDDVYKNGWDNASLTISQDGSVLDTFELKEGESTTEELCVPSGSPLELQYNSGSWDGENTYVLYDPDGNIVYSDGPFPTTQLVGLNIDFSEYMAESCSDRLNYISGSDCDDEDFTKTGEDKDGDGSSLCDGDCDDYDATISGEDLDDDGFTSCTGDCDDSNPFDMNDADEDGFTLCDGDCNDYSSLVQPQAFELIGDGLDQDCDGEDATTMVALGSEHSCVIDANGELSCFGSTNSIQDIPTELQVQFVDVEYQTTTVITNDGKLSCFGDHCNNLSDDSFIQISQGAYHGCGITVASEISCWGEENAIGTIPEGKFISVAAGNAQTCALGRNREIHCWGENSYNVVSSFPEGPMRMIASGGGQFCALDDEGDLICWGNTGFADIPTGHFERVSLGLHSGCVLDKIGDISCWGLSEEVPSTNSQEGSFVQVDVGETHACALDNQSFLYCWGDGTNGKKTVSKDLCLTFEDRDGDGEIGCLGDCDDLDASVNNQDIDGDGYSPCTGDCDENDVTKNGLDVDGDGSSVSCDNDCNDFNTFLNTRDDDGDGFTTCDNDCDDTDAGLNLSDKDGDSWTSCDGDLVDTDIFSRPNGTELLLDNVDQDQSEHVASIVKVGNGFACALDNKGEIHCFGDSDDFGQISNSPDGLYSYLDVGFDQACAIDQQGQVRCWGRNNVGQTDTPTGTFKMVSVGRNHTCVLDVNGLVTCWGDDSLEVLSNIPDQQIVELHSGDDFSCAIAVDGEITCWGDNEQGQTTPPTGLVQQLNVGDTHACAVMRDESYQCWGSISNIPFEEDFVRIASGQNSSCGLTTDGRVLCWDVDGEREDLSYLSGLHVDYGKMIWRSNVASESPSVHYGEGFVPYLYHSSTELAESSNSESISNVMYSISGKVFSVGETHQLRIRNYSGLLFHIDGTQYFSVGMSWQPSNEDTAEIVLTEGYHDINVEYLVRGSNSYIYLEELENDTYVPFATDAFFYQPSNIRNVSVSDDWVCFTESDNTFACRSSSGDIYSEDLEEGWCGEFIDEDGDGFSAVCDNDCDDTDPLMNPGDYDGDGLSTCEGDCNDVDAIEGSQDLDGDGFEDCALDCDGTSIRIHPNAIDLVGDGIDQDCDGVDQNQMIASRLYSHVCILDAGNIKCHLRGNEDVGQAEVPDGIFTQVEVGEDFTCALHDIGNVQCWGSINELWEGSYTQITASSDSFCALDSTGNVYCNGEEGKNSDREGPYLFVQQGEISTCAGGVDGELDCWGYPPPNTIEAQLTQLAFGSTNSNCGLDQYGKVHCNNKAAYISRILDGYGYQKIVAEETEYCVFTKDNEAHCFSEQIQLYTEGEFIDISIGCGLTFDGQVYCLEGGEDSYSVDGSMVMIDNDGDGDSFWRDCNDSNAYVHDLDLDQDGLSICDGDRNDNDFYQSSVDNDGDGVSGIEGDCDDADPSVGTNDSDGDGVDADCEEDCDDSEPWVFSFRPELVDDGIDQDCDGSDLETGFEIGYHMGCVVHKYGRIQCWGDETPTILDEPAGDFVQVQLGNDFACALDDVGEVTCWGTEGRVPPPGPFVQLTGQYHFMCGLDEEGFADCWLNHPEWVGTVPPQIPFRKVDAGYSHACGLDLNDQIHCWGDNSYGQNDAPNDRFQDVTLGAYFSCGLRFDGTYTCWGQDNEGQISDQPNMVFEKLVAGYDAVCGIDANQNLTCWGRSTFDMLDIPDVSFVDVNLGRANICGVDIDGELHCWGADYTGLRNLDQDGDGLDKFEDCDDTNDSIGANHEDCDGDGIFVEEDCDDNDNVRPLQDEDCDGFLTEVDCDDSDESTFNGSEDCPEKSCWHILQKNPFVADGRYWIDPDGNGGIESFCDMKTNGGGWTMIAGFSNDDELNWIDENVVNWMNDSTFGTLESYGVADYKSSAFSRLTDAGDVLFKDSNDEWLSFQNLISDSFSNTMLNYSSCQTSTIPYDSKNSSDPLFESHAEVVFNSRDYQQGGCPVFPYIYTSSAMIAFSGNHCYTTGLGYNQDETYGSSIDGGFCISGTQYTGSGFCSNYSLYESYGMPYGMSFNSCSYSTIWVRPSDIDGDGISTKDDCDDLDPTIINDCDEDGIPTEEDCDDSNSNFGSNPTDCDGDGISTEEDCDDKDISSFSILNDADCDGISTEEDCDDNNIFIFDSAEDNDCDGFLTEIDCDDNDAMKYNGSEDCSEKSCWHILQKNNVAPDGIYWIDPDGSGSFEVLCDMTTDGGGWTMIAGFSNDDELNWIDENVVNWMNDSTFGTLESYGVADYKSSAFSRLTDAGDVLFKDSNDEWLSFQNLISDSFSNTMLNYSSCQTSTIPYDSKNSSDPLFESHAEVVFNSRDYQHGGCPVSPHAYTSSAMIAFSGNHCYTTGLGYNQDETYGSSIDGGFCISGTQYTGSGFCSNYSLYNSYEMPYRMNSSSCSYSTIWVRPSDIDGDGYSVEEDCDDNDVTVHDSCN